MAAFGPLHPTKECAMCAFMHTKDCHIYLITPPKIEDAPSFLTQLDDGLKAVRVSALQIRLKGMLSHDVPDLAEKIRDVAWRHNVCVLMNDDVLLAKKLKLDGVHLGQSDMPLKEARLMLGDRAMIGITCHNSRHLAMEASENGADYVAFGAFFPTKTKEVLYQAELETLSIWQETMTTPCVAIGGITPENLLPIRDAGADFIAVSHSVFGHENGIKAGLLALEAALLS